MEYLLGVTVGPVQTNIQESRKLIDLRNSSRLISDIMKQVKEYITKEVDSNMKVIYPYIIEDEKAQDITNYMIVKIDGINNLSKIKEEVYKQIRGQASILEEVYFMFWAVEPLQDDTDYEDAYERLTRKLRSIKNTYEFSNILDGKKRGKCSICGKRERVSNKEQLCNVCLFKRKYMQNADGNLENYQSTYTISIQHWKDQNEKKIDHLIVELEKLFKEGHLDKYYSLYTVNRLIERLSGKQQDKFRLQEEIDGDLENRSLSNEEIVQHLESIKDEMQKLYHAEKDSIKMPHYKYCFLQIDIDDLGKWISGEQNQYHILLEESQKEISKSLSTFAWNLKQQFEGTGVSVIYAGGDDFLAVLPVEDLFDAVDKIEKIFNEFVREKLYDSGHYKKQMTYSTSITLTKCKEEMAFALRQTNLTLEEVKQRFAPHKNGVGISYIINSGKVITSYLTSECLKKYKDNILFYKNVKDNATFTYIDSFEDEFKKIKYDKLESEEIEILIKMMELEFKRLFEKNFYNQNDHTEKYLALQTDLFAKLVQENSEDEIRIDFANIMSAYRIYEKLVDFEYLTDIQKEEK